MPRFVVLEHIGTASYKPGRHWDLMLEVDGGLKTWELDEIPAVGLTVHATALPDHRLQYLDYEGPLTDQRGDVRQLDAGVYEIVSEQQDKLVIRLAGMQLQCQLTLKRDTEAPTIWQASVKPATCAPPSA